MGIFACNFNIFVESIFVLARKWQNGQLGQFTALTAVCWKAFSRLFLLDNSIFVAVF